MTDASKPLSDRIRECMNASFMPAEGAKYVGIYDDGYRQISSLITIAHNNDIDTDTRDKAKRFLAEIDARNTIGDLYQDVLRFTASHKVAWKKVQKRRKAQHGQRRLRPNEITHLRRLLERKDLKDTDMSELKRINASVTPDFMLASDDFFKLRNISIEYGQLKPQPQISHVNGWRSIDDKLFDGLQNILDRDDVSIATKREASNLLESVKNRKLKVEHYVDANQLVANNRLTKKASAKLVSAVNQFQHAVMVACQACDNLDDITVPAMSKAVRTKLVTQISNSANNLLKLQYALLLQEENPHEG